MRALIVDDDDASRNVMDGIMRGLGYQTVICQRGLEALDVVSNDAEPPSLMLLDWHMPGMSGVDVCREIRRRGRSPYSYVILVTGKVRREDLIEGLQAGADDYVTKPIDLQEFRARISNARRILDVQSQLFATSEAHRTAASHDSLTGLWNRTAIMEILARDVARADREGGAVGVVMADIDHFKTINDSQGHQAGDAVLREAARRFEGCLRPYDSIGRYGGEEFLIVLPGCTPTNAHLLSERVRREFADAPFSMPQRPAAVMISLGVSVSRTGVANEATALVAEADEALYAAKRAGRNCVRLSASRQVVLARVEPDRLEELL